MDQDVEVTLTYILRNGIQIFNVKEDEIMAVSGIGNNYSYPVQNGISTDTKDVKKSGTGTTQKSTGVSYEKTISDSTSAGLEFMKKMEKENSGTKFFVGTVSYGQTYGNSTDTNFVVNPKFLSKLGNDEATQKQFEEGVKYLHDFAQRQREQAKASGREIISQGWFCDENGNWGGWTVSRPTNKTSVLQTMSDKAKEIREEKLAEKKEKQLKEKKQAEKELREHFGDRFKGMNDISVDKPEIKVEGNSITVPDSPLKEWIKQHGVLRSKSETGGEVWHIPSSTSLDDLKNISEKGFREMGFDQDEHNFWYSLTQEPTFLSMKYSPEEVRNRLAEIGIQTGFFDIKVGDASATQFLTQGKNAVAIYSKEQYDQRYEYITSDRFFKEYEAGYKVTIGGEEYTLGEDKKLDIPYGADIYDVQYGVQS